MNLDVAYILGAGLGTRMGPVGEDLPKLLWPVFEKSLLELQINYAIECGVKKIYLNTHFQADKIEKYITEKNIDINILHEEELLDIGGAVHNLARKLNYQGRILILNGDQFLMLEKGTFQGFVEKSQNYVATLLGLEVPPNSQYNELIVKNNILKSIEKPSSDRDYFTYSGVSIINCSLLIPFEGKSKFFDTVASYKDKEVYVYEPGSSEYWDFGTTERYLCSMRKVLTVENSRFKKFLILKKALLENKINELFCYNAKGKKYSINLREKFLDEGFGNVVISGNDLEIQNKLAVIYNEKISIL